MWKVDVTTGTKYDDLMRVIDKSWWYASIDYEDGMIIESSEGNTAVDAIIAAMRKLTFKAQVSFARYAYETKTLMTFYWIDYVSFALNGEIYEIIDSCGKASLLRISDHEFVNLESLPFERVDMNRTNPPVKQVYDRLAQYQQTLNWQNELLETMDL